MHNQKIHIKLEKTTETCTNVLYIQLKFLGFYEHSENVRLEMTRNVCGTGNDKDFPQLFF